MHKLHILPSVFVDLPTEEKAFIIAAINMKIDADKKKAKEIESKSRKKR